ncbi:hypothetical protein KY342_03930 [Candidatus Woesearchaeota archaeon]|nr:hypothetical protein [Candidatus Woesearchaeota archaeon]
MEKFNQEKLESLEFQTDQVYNALKRALSTKSKQDISWAAALVSPGLEAQLRSLIGENFIAQAQKTPLYDRYLFFYVVSEGIVFSLTTYKGHKNSGVNYEDIINAMQQRKRPTHLSNLVVVYCWSGEFNKTLGLLDYIKVNYPKPSAE